MIFLTPPLFVAGVAAATIPVAIHLLSRGKPRRVVFAALRFTQATFAANRRKLRLKRFLLLSLRVMLLVALGFALARPIATPKTVGLTSSLETETESENIGVQEKNAPAAVAIVLDTSLRMGRVKDGAPLLARARATARTILDQAPKGSELAILDGSTSGDGFQSDRVAAKERLEKTTILPGGRSAAESTLAAITLVNGSKLSRREIYVLSDQTTSGWQERDLRRIRRATGADAATPDARTPTFYFVDFGDDAYRNAAVLDASPSAETLAEGAPLRVDAVVERVAAEPGEMAIEALFFDASAIPASLSADELVKNEKLAFRRERQTISFDAGRSRRDVAFHVSELRLGDCVGVIHTTESDALEGDDARAFAVRVVPDWRILVVAPSPIREKALFIEEALAPEEYRKTGRAPFELDVVPYDATTKETGAVTDLASATPATLQRYRAILLLDPPGLAPETFAKLADFAENGGGVGVFLGRAASVAAMQTSEALRFFGSRPVKQETAPSPGLAITPTSYDEPLLSEFRAFERDGIPWDAAPVARYWRLDELDDATSVVARLTDASAGDVPEDAPPALVEHRIGRGLVATMTTPVSDGAQESPWNMLTSGDAVWIFVVLADSMTRRLASTSSSILNYSTGETITLRTELREFPAVATLHTPEGEDIATPTDVERRQIRLPGLRTPGVFRVTTTPGRGGETLDQVFTVSTLGSESDMSRRSPEEWARFWENLPCRTLDVNVTADELEARDGKETEPYAMLVLILTALFLLETVVANRFYRAASDANARRTAPST